MFVQIASSLLVCPDATVDGLEADSHDAGLARGDGDLLGAPCEFEK